MFPWERSRRFTTKLWPKKSGDGPRQTWETKQSGKKRGSETKLEKTKQPGKSNKGSFKERKKETTLFTCDPPARYVENKPMDLRSLCVNQQFIYVSKGSEVNWSSLLFNVCTFFTSIGIMEKRMGGQFVAKRTRCKHEYHLTHLLNPL